MSFEKIKNVLKSLHNNLSKKYSISSQEYYKLKVTSLMFHKRSHYTTIFIEYLISDDLQEFLTEYYTKNNLIPYLFYLIDNNQKCHFSPMIINEYGRKLICDNKRIKSLIFQYYSKMNQISGSKQNQFSSNNSHISYILPIDNNNSIEKKCYDISEETIQNDGEFSQITVQKKNDNKGAINNESESTINNLNVNDDISFSIDLTLNKKYDGKVLRNNIEFVKGKNNKNDEELVKLINKLKPLDTNLIYDRKKTNKINYNYCKYMDPLKKRINNKKLENDLKYVNKYCEKLKIKNSRNNSTNKNTNTNSFNINSVSNINLGDSKKKNNSLPKQPKNDMFKNKSSKEIIVKSKNYNKPVKFNYNDNIKYDFIHNSKNIDNSINVFKLGINKKINKYENNTNKTNIYINVTNKNSMSNQSISNSSIKIKKNVFTSEFNISNIKSNNAPKYALLSKRDNLSSARSFKTVVCKSQIKIKTSNNINGAIDIKPYISKEKIKIKSEEKSKKSNIKNYSYNSKTIKINKKIVRNYSNKTKYILPLYKDESSYFSPNLDKKNKKINAGNNHHLHSIENQHCVTNKNVFVLDKIRVNLNEQKIKRLISVK